MGEVVAYNICGNEVAYDPGIWFNSAKFFDIEYQVYGAVLSRPPEYHKMLFWKHADNTKSIRLVYHKDSYAILGFNLMGIRFRHEVCEKWIKEKTHVEKVLEKLELAEFDPEFYDSYINDIIAAYNAQEGKQVRKSENKGFNKVFKFLKQSVL